MWSSMLVSNAAKVASLRTVDLKAAAADKRPSPDEKKSLLQTSEVYSVMKDTKVIFSFGSRNGGLDLAKRLREKVIDTFELTESSAYIDCMNLRKHKDTRIQKCILKPSGKVIEKVLNPHWAEFYYMGVCIADIVVLVIDKAWMSSSWCAGEGMLFLKNMMGAYYRTSHAKPYATGSTFYLLVVFDREFYKTPDVVKKILHEQLMVPEDVLKERVGYIPANLCGEKSNLPGEKEWSNFLGLIEKYSEAMKAEMGSSDGKRTEKLLKDGYSKLYDCHWRDLANKHAHSEFWWDTDAEIKEIEQNTTHS